jgi:O-methyltransferase involved in polyketide biosynthesis
MALSPLAQTLLLPLWGRARYGRLVPTGADPIAAEALARVGADEATLERGLGDYGVLAFGLRAAWIDAEARRWLADAPPAPGGHILNLGAGLDTLLQRVDDGRCTCTSVDTPEVIALRRAHLPAHPRERLVAARLEDPEALVDLDPQGPPAFVVIAGVSMYLERAELHALFARLSERLAPRSRVLLDAYRPFTAWMTNTLAGLTGVSEAPVHGDAADTAALAQVAPRLALREARDLFHDAATTRALPLGAWPRAQVALARATGFTTLQDWEVP